MNIKTSGLKDAHQHGDVEDSTAQQLKEEISAMLNNWDSNHKQAFLDKFALEHLPKLRKLSSI